MIASLSTTEGAVYFSLVDSIAATTIFPYSLCLRNRGIRERVLGRNCFFAKLPKIFAWPFDAAIKAINAIKAIDNNR